MLEEYPGGTSGEETLVLSLNHLMMEERRTARHRTPVVPPPLSHPRPRPLRVSRFGAPPYMARDLGTTQPDQATLDLA